MTTCHLITKPITRMVDEDKTIDEIANSVCPTVKYGRAKIIRVIKDFLGEDYLFQHAETLKYDIEKAQLAKTKKSHKKIDANADNDNSCKLTEKYDKKEMTLDEVVLTLEELIKQTTPTTFISALETVMERHKELME